ncbi:thioredoxin-like protein [Peniophora sp. CONT]|nr:thioredoxin-like protein [Peniophora sp. CONT]
MSGRKVKLVYISDYTCPWCFIGYKELQNAIKQTPQLGFNYEIEVRPFTLATSEKQCAGHTKEEAMVKKFGRERWENCKNVVTQKGQEVGIEFAMSGPLSQTMLAHRLMAKVQAVGGSEAQMTLLQAIFSAYHEQEMDIGSEDVLADIVEEQGILSRDEAISFLQSDELFTKVDEQIKEARTKGVTGVPFTIIDGRWAVSGGQPAPVFVQIFNKLAAACGCGPGAGYLHDAPTPKAVGECSKTCGDEADGPMCS